MSRLSNSIFFQIVLWTLVLFSPASSATLTPAQVSRPVLEPGGQPVISDQIKGHSLEISTFVLSRDGRYALTGDADENNILWDLRSVAIPRTIGKPDPVRLWLVDAVFSPDSSTLVWARNRKHMPVIWDVKSGRRLGVLASKENGHKAEIVSLAYSTDGRYLASGDRQGVIVLWDMKDRSVVWRAVAHSGEVRQLVFSGPAELASSGEDGALLLWNAEKPLPLTTLLKASDEIITSLTVSGDGSVIYAASDEMRVRGWNVPLRTLRTTIPFSERQINSIAVSPSGDLLAVLEEDNNVLLWNIRENRVAWRNQLVDSALKAAFSPDGRSLYTAGGDRWVREWDVVSGRLIRKFGGVAE